MPSQRLIEYAKKASQLSDCEHKLAAILYKGGSILRITPNEYKTMQYRKKYFFHDAPSRHAELSCIHNVPRDIIKKCSMLVVRVNKKLELQSAKPCYACVGALFDSGIRKVYYSSYSGEILKLNFDEFRDGKYRKEIYQNYQR